MGFIKLHDDEILKLATGGIKGKALAGDAWALYCCLRRFCWELGEGKEDTKKWRRYFCFPSQTAICEYLGWALPKVRACGNKDTSQKVSRSLKKLEEAGLIEIISSKDGSKRAKQIRAGLGRSNGRVNVYHLKLWEDLDTSQKRHVSHNKNDETSIKNDMRDNSKTTCKEDESNPLVEEFKNKSLFEEENDWSVKTVESKHGHSYSKSQIEKMLVDDFETASKLILSVFTVGELETIDSWLSEWKSKIEVKSLIEAVSVKLMGG